MARTNRPAVLNLRGVTRTLGLLLIFLSVALIGPLVVDLIYQEGVWWSFALAAGLAALVGGGAFYWIGREDRELELRDGFAIVSLTWIVLSLIGALPFVLSGVLTSYTDAFFETMSGFTTTGASILGGEDTPAIEDVPHAFLFWRSLTQWLGGMGIIVLALAILPLLGVGGMQLFKAEAPGPSHDKITPRVSDTARRLWLLYVGLTLLQTLLLLPAMSPFDAVNHAFTSMSTGGFSTKNASIGQFESVYVEWVIIIFMMIGGISFGLLYKFMRGNTRALYKDEEFRGYMLIFLIGGFFVFLALYGVSDALLQGHPLEASIRTALFQVVSIATTTGYGTVDYELYPLLATGILFMLFFAGGMAGSTAGGIKVIRHVLLIKSAIKEMKLLIHPRAVIPIRYNSKSVSGDIMGNVNLFIMLYLTLMGVGTILMSATGMDVMSALSTTLTSLGNIGPAFGAYGPTESFASISNTGKWILAMLMMVGRLEVVTVLILFLPDYWRR